MSICFNCGQEMPSVLDFTSVAAIRTALSASYICWEALSEEDSFTIPGLAETAKVSVVAADAKSDYDSYGDATGSGFVVFKVSQDGKSATYKIEGTQSSYGGWDWDEEYTVKVNAVPKTVTVWEREN